MKKRRVSVGRRSVARSLPWYDLRYEIAATTSDGTSVRSARLIVPSSSFSARPRQAGRPYAADIPAPTKATVVRMLRTRDSIIRSRARTSSGVQRAGGLILCGAKGTNESLLIESGTSLCPSRMILLRGVICKYRVARSRRRRCRSAVHRLNLSSLAVGAGSEASHADTSKRCQPI